MFDVVRAQAAAKIPINCSRLNIALREELVGIGALNRRVETHSSPSQMKR
jgi:hypothetical protein